MDWAVTCPCGHSMEAHDAAGCTDRRGQPCGCRRDRYAVLDAAVEAVRSRPWTATAPPGAEV